MKYFSGAATYKQTVQIDRRWFRAGQKILLDLGTVKDLAEVSINGEALGILWKAPYQVDVTSALKPGPNQLEIKITNEWTNRIIGDRLAAPDKKVLAPTPPPPGNPNTTPPLSESGLLGPVRFLSVDRRD